jgi:hypothetical protein
MLWKHKEARISSIWEIREGFKEEKASELGLRDGQSYSYWREGVGPGINPGKQDITSMNKVHATPTAPATMTLAAIHLWTRLVAFQPK